MVKVKKDLTGMVFGRLTVLEQVEDYISPQGAHRAMWLCQCECGKTTIVSGNALKRHLTKSCGCLRDELKLFMPIENISGQKFGRLTVIEKALEGDKWKCECECGTVKDISQASLLSGLTQSCGCLQRERASKSSFIDLVGQKFGRLTVLYLSENKTKSRGRKWVCQCECGTIKEVAQQALISGTVVSCGCYNREQVSKRGLKDLTGQAFGRWKVISRAEPPIYIKNNSGVWWLCECTCEKHTRKIIKSQSLISGKSKSCGCLHKETVGKLNFTDLTGKRFGRLTVIKQSNAPETNKNKSATYWLCRCDCGSEVVVIAANLNNGHTQSCGCINSKGELKIIQLLLENNMPFIHDRGIFKDCKLSTGGTARFDFYIDNSYVIEYDGEVHYQTPKSGWFTEEKLDITRQRDMEKNEYCWSHNIPIIRIPYWEYDNISIDDLKLETTRFLCTKETINQDEILCNSSIYKTK